MASDELYPYLVHDAEGVEEGAEKEEKQLGAGSFGYIYKVRVRGVERIAKRLHKAFIDRSRVSSKEVDSIEAKFRNECIILSKLRHPNIVQFIGVHYGLRGRNDITLIMECLSTDLDNFLVVHPNIPLPVKLSILRDVSFGLVYLHEYKPPIIHRDLTARNVLVTDRCHAKIADLGVAKLVDIQDQFATSHTHTPGQMFYMPPEALTEKASCTPKVDIFSFGHLTLYVVVQEFPKVFTVTVTPDLQRRGIIELVRRERNIKRVGKNHCLYSIIIDCLLDSPDRRPDTRYLNERMVFLSTLNPLTLKDISQLADKDPCRECDHTKLEEEIVRLREESEEHTKHALKVIRELTDTKTALELEIEQLRLKNVAVIDEMAVAKAEADLYKADILEECRDTQGALNDLQKKMNRLSSKLKDDRNSHGNGYSTEQEHQRSSPCSDEKAGTANLRVSGAAGHEGHHQPKASLGSTATFIYKESTTISLAFHDSSYNTLVETTASLFNLDLTCLQNNLYKVTGNMDAIIDFRQILDKKILALPMPSGHSNQVPEATGHGAEEEAPHPQFPLSRYDRFTDQNRDILALLNKLPDGKIPGVHYFPGGGIVYIEKEDSAKKMSKYQSAYQKVRERMKVEVIPLPPESSSETANEICSLLSSENSKYSQCVFTYDDSAKSMKILSISYRQFDQAKQVLLERCQFNPAGCLTLPLAQRRRLTLKKSDIVKEQVDIVVNAANERLQHAGGVALAIDRASGGAVQRYCDQYRRSYGEIRVGNVAVTKAGGALKCRYVIHAVGPTASDYNIYDCKALLEEVTNNILRAAEEKEVSSIAIPAINSGIYGVDKNLVAQCLVDSISSFRFSSPMPVLSDIRIVIIDEPTYRCFADYIQKKQDKLSRVG